MSDATPRAPSARFLFDYASPWAYLADATLARRLPGVRVRYEPVYLRGFESFSKGVPYDGNKLQYIARDLARCAAWWGVPVRLPSRFPINGVYALRAALVAQREGTFEALHPALFHAAWRDDRDVSTREGVLALVRELGLAPEPFERGFDDEAVKALLRQQTEAARDAGVFGVPSFFVGDELFWGQDRMDYVARALGVEGE